MPIKCKYCGGQHERAAQVYECFTRGQHERAAQVHAFFAAEPTIAPSDWIEPESLPAGALGPATLASAAQVQEIMGPELEVTNQAAPHKVTHLPKGAEHRPSAMTPEGKRLAAAARLQNPSTAEAALWDRLNEAKLAGFRFIREFEIGGWYADFYCPAARLVVEVDGRHHRERLAEDNRRDEIMRANHYRVLRIPAARAFKNLDDVVDQIRGAVDFPWSRERRDRWRLQQANEQPRPDPDKDERSLRVGEDTVPPILTRQSPRPRKGAFKCPRCNKTFVADVDGHVECRRCRIKPQPICSSCHRVGAWVSLDRRVCRRCADLNDVARQQGGSGYTPQGPLSNKRGRAKKIF
jgi:very-short-patch-repair endonuclease